MVDDGGIGDVRGRGGSGLVLRTWADGMESLGRRFVTIEENLLSLPSSRTVQLESRPRLAGGSAIVLRGRGE